MLNQKYWHTEGKEWAYEKCYGDFEKKSINRSIHFHNLSVFTNKNSKELMVAFTKNQTNQNLTLSIVLLAWKNKKGAVNSRDLTSTGRRQILLRNKM